MENENQPRPDSLITPPQAPQNPLPVPPLQQPMKPKGKNSKLIKIIITVLLLIVAGVGAWLWYSKKPSTPESTTVTKKEIPLIKIGMTEGPIKIYPDIEIGSDELDINRQIFEGLLRYESGTKLKPLLAESWTNPDESTWVFTLKQGVKFHTGRTLTAKDVKYSFEEIKKNETFSTLFASTIKSVDVVDDFTVKITTDGPDAVLLNKLTFLYIMDSQSGNRVSPENGTGPYTIKPGTEVGEKKIELVAFDDYHGGRALTRALEMNLYTTDEAVEALRKKEINLGGTITEDNIAELTPLGYATYYTKPLNVYHLLPNQKMKDNPLANLKVRQAVYYALDGEVLAKARKLKGISASQIVPEEIPGYNPAIKREPRNIEKAKQLLAEAGYPNGVTFTLTHFSEAHDAYVEIARQLKEANITALDDSIPEAEVLIDKAYGGKSQVYFASYSSDVFDAIDVTSLFFKDTPNYSNAKVNELIAKANTTIDASKRLATLQELSKVLMDDMAWIPLYLPQFAWAVDPTYVMPLDQLGGSLGVYFWQVYQK